MEQSLSTRFLRAKLQQHALYVTSSPYAPALFIKFGSALTMLASETPCSGFVSKSASIRKAECIEGSPLAIGSRLRSEPDLKKAGPSLLWLETRRTCVIFSAVVPTCIERRISSEQTHPDRYRSGSHCSFTPSPVCEVRSRVNGVWCFCTDQRRLQPNQFIDCFRAHLLSAICRKQQAGGAVPFAIVTNFSNAYNNWVKIWMLSAFLHPSTKQHSVPRKL